MGLERNQWLGIGILSGMAYLFGKERAEAEFFDVETDDEGRYLCDYCGKNTGKLADYNWQDIMVRWDLENGAFTGTYKHIDHMGNENDFICEECNERHFGAESFDAEGCDHAWAITCSKCEIKLRDLGDEI